MQRVVEDVREGRLDFALTKPADAQVLVSVRDVRLWQLTDVLVGVVVLLFALIQIGEAVSVGELASFVGVLAVGLVSIYCFWLMLASASFWLVRMNEVQELFEGVYRAGQYPVGIYPGWLKYGLTFLVPLAFAVTVPSEAVTGRLTWQAVAVAGASALALMAFSRWFWRRGLRRYNGASS
jgi:ABC-2 type transport system permease protein